MFRKLALPGIMTVFILFTLMTGCISPASGPSLAQPALPSTQTMALPTLAAEPNEITFEVTFDKNHNCNILGPSVVPTGDYLLSLYDQSELKIDLAVTHLIDGHSYQDLLNMQNRPGEPFLKVYWMSQPRYYTKDHLVWNYSLDEAGEHVVLILKHVFEGIWICDPFQVVDPPLE